MADKVPKIKFNNGEEFPILGLGTWKNYTSDSTMSLNVPEVKLNNGVCMPVLGLGTWRAQPGDVSQAVRHAIRIGIRHFDCAMLYSNEVEIGEALRAEIENGTVRRRDLFITSKLWCNAMRPDLVEPTLKKSLKNFDLEYLDLYLIHWPMGFQEGGDFYPLGEDGKVVISDVDYVDTWKAMEKVYDKGLVRSIGVSNFNCQQLERLLKGVVVKPVVNQVEYHPYLQQKKLLKLCKENNLVVVAYAPLGSNDRPWAKENDKRILEDSSIRRIAEKYSKTPAQVILRYLIQLGVATIPKSSNPKRIEENANIFDFQLDKSDMDALDSLNCNIRYHEHSEAVHHPTYPFHEE